MKKQGLTKQQAQQMNPDIVAPTVTCNAIRRAFGIDTMETPVLFKRDRGEPWALVPTWFAVGVLREIVGIAEGGGR